jgi:hypothetical protein
MAPHRPGQQKQNGQDQLPTGQLILIAETCQQFINTHAQAGSQHIVSAGLNQPFFAGRN